MKLLVFAALLVMITNVQAQYIKDKKLFAKAFSDVFNDRGTGFDALRKKQGDADTLKNASSIMPMATECYISSNYVFGARYEFKDSLKAISFYKEIQGLIKYTAEAFKTKATFTPYNGDPFYLQFYFSDSVGYTETLQALYFSSDAADEPKNFDEDEEDEDEDAPPSRQHAKKPGNITYEVLMLINPGDEYSYYTHTGEKIKDGTFTNYVNNIIMSKDTVLEQVRTNKHIGKKGNYAYDSKIELNGFKTEITVTEMTTTTFVNVSSVRECTAETWDDFEQMLDSVVLKLKAALPADFSYILDPENQEVAFTPARHAKYKDNVAEVKLKYSQVENKVDRFRMELAVLRIAMRGTKTNKNTTVAAKPLTAESFLNDNKTKPNVKTTSSGLQYLIQKTGSGSAAGPRDEVVFHYKATLTDGTEIDNTYKQGKPITAPISALLKGIAEGLQLMRPGSKFTLYIPPSLGYGQEKAGKVPGGSVLICDIELISVKKN